MLSIRDVDIKHWRVPERGVHIYYGRYQLNTMTTVMDDVLAKAVRGDIIGSFVLPELQKNLWAVIYGEAFIQARELLAMLDPASPEGKKTAELLRCLSLEAALDRPALNEKDY